MSVISAGQKFSFVSNVSGEIDQIQSKFEPAVKDIVFKRKVGIDVVADALSNYIGRVRFWRRVGQSIYKG